jgi:Protein of unknown function (DUF2516)
VLRSRPGYIGPVYEFLNVLDNYILWGIGLLAIPVGGYAFVHALMQRADAFTAADKLTKPAWLGITGASVLILVVFYNGLGSSGSLFWLAALVASLVYIVDVKPAVVGVQGGGPHW